MKYYSTQRPVAPGTFPKPVWNKVAGIHNYDQRTYCEELGREVWGYIDYEQPLDPELAAGYELQPAPCKIKSVWFVGTDRWGNEVYKDKDGQLWKYAEPGPMPRERHERLHSIAGNELDGEPDWPMPSDIDYKIEGDGT